MSCKTINEELRIYSCNKEDVENEWMNIRTDTYHANYDINTLNIFYNPETDKLTLVEDTEYFESLKHITENYMTFSNEQRDEFHKVHIPKSMESFLNVLKATVDIREKRNSREKIQEKVQQLRKITSHGNYSYDVFNEIACLYDSYDSGSKNSIALLAIYNYGVIQGKRAERAKKKSMRRELMHEKE